MDELDRLLSDLVAINSINPDMVPGAPGEGEIARYIADWMSRAGLETHVDESIPDRPNIIGIARGSGGGRTLMLNGHIDTVGVMGMPEPHAPRIENGRMFGRGAYDMKSGLAACMVAAAEAGRRRLRGDVIVTAVMDEECAGLGTMAIAEKYRADGAIVAEPTEMRLVVAHKGFVWLEIETEGVAAHGSRPDLGVDAITHMGRVLVELERLAEDLRTRHAHPWLGSGSVHASLIRGGRELSSYPNSCFLSIERRTIPGETPETVEAELQGIVDRLSRSDPTFSAVVRRGLDRPPLQAPEGSAIVRILRQSAESRLNQTCEMAGAAYWTDAATLWAAGIPSVLFGPIGAGAHAIEEWVDLQSVRDCCEIYLAAAVEFCR